MKRFPIAALFGGALMLISAGCLHCEFKGEKYPATTEVKVLEMDLPAPAGYASIGQARVWGEASGTTDDELREKMLKLAKESGADAVRYLGIVRIPSGLTVQQPDLSTAVGPGHQEISRTERQIMDTPGMNAVSQSYNRQLNAEFFRLAPEK